MVQGASFLGWARAIGEGTGRWRMRILSIHRRGALRLARSVNPTIRTSEELGKRSRQDNAYFRELAD